MIAYILDNYTLNIKDILEFEEYEFREDMDYSEKSSITVAKKPAINNDDFIFCKDGNENVFVGICVNYTGKSNNSEYDISMQQKEQLFDRSIFVESEELISSVGIEDFIVHAIESNFTDSGDTLMDKNYISVQALTHTPIAAKVEADDGVYNLKTYLGNAKQYYGIFTEFEFEKGHLTINIVNRDETDIPIDAEVSDISDYKETYEVSILARLWVNWKVPDIEDSNGNITVGAVTRRKFYLLENRTISEDMSNVNRVVGIAKSVFIEADTEEEMLQKVRNEFTSNRYNHKITFNLYRNSKLYPAKRFYVGCKCLIKTKTGIRTTMITKLVKSSKTSMTNLTFGNLKITLIEKIRR